MNYSCFIHPLIFCLNFNLRTAVYAEFPLIYSLSACIYNFMNFMATDLKSVCSKKLLIFAYFLIPFHGFYFWINNSSLSSSLSSHKLFYATTNVTDTIVKILVNSHAHWITVKQRPLSSSSQKPVSGCRFLLYACYLSFTLISLSADVQTNPGPDGSNFWYQNVRSLKANYRDSTTNCVRCFITKCE